MGTAAGPLDGSEEETWGVLTARARVFSFMVISTTSISLNFG